MIALNANKGNVPDSNAVGGSQVKAASNPRDANLSLTNEGIVWSAVRLSTAAEVEEMEGPRDEVPKSSSLSALRFTGANED